MDTLTLDDAAVVWSRPRTDRAGRPLLVLLHGFGGHERDLAAYFAQLPEEYAIASVRAPLPKPPAWAWYPANPHDTASTLAEKANPAADALLDWIREQRGHPFVDLLGYSQGGSVAVHALRRSPDAIRAIVTLAGFRAPGRQAGDVDLRARLHPAFMGHGARDDVIPPRDADRLESWLRRHSALEARRYPDLGHRTSAEQLDHVTAFLRRTAPDI